MKIFGFDQQENNLWLETIDLALRIEKRFAAISLLPERINPSEIFYVAENDNEIDALEEKIEKKALDLIILGLIGPAELQKLVGILKLVRELERIADYLVDIAEIAVNNQQLGYLEPLLKTAYNQYKLVLEILMSKDVDKAITIDKQDDELDQKYQNFKSKFAGMSTSALGYAADSLLIAKYLERIGDHTVNLAEILIFTVTGQLRYFHNN